MNINSYNGYLSTMYSTQQSNLASELFSKLDTAGKGYLEQSDFSSLVSNLDQQLSETAAEEMFSALDQDSDGTVNADEFSKVFESLVYSAKGTIEGAMPPPPPPPAVSEAEDEGKTIEELTEIATTAAGTDSELAAAMQQLVENFDDADTNQDGVVTAEEARAYKESQSSASGESHITRKESSIEQTLAHTLRQLAQSYGMIGQQQSVAESAVSIDV